MKELNELNDADIAALGFIVFSTSFFVFCFLINLF